MESDGVGVVIRSIELYDLVNQADRVRSGTLNLLMAVTNTIYSSLSRIQMVKYKSIGHVSTASVNNRQTKLISEWFVHVSLPSAILADLSGNRSLLLETLP